MMATVTPIGRKGKAHFYIKEHMDALGVSDTDLANRLDTSRTTVWRWRNEQWRLRPGKIKAIADALGIDERALYETPKKEVRPSLDEEARDLPDPLYAVALQTIRALKGT